MYKLYIRKDKCMRCGACTLYCPLKCLVVKDNILHYDRDRCTGCGKCTHHCFFVALRLLDESSDS